MKTIYKQELIIEDGDNQIVLDAEAMDDLYQELRTILGKHDDY